MYAANPEFQNLFLIPMFVMALLTLLLSLVLLVYGIVMYQVVRKMDVDALRLGTITRNFVIFAIVSCVMFVQLVFSVLDLPFANFFDPASSYLGE